MVSLYTDPEFDRIRKPSRGEPSRSPCQSYFSASLMATCADTPDASQVRCWVYLPDHTDWYRDWICHSVLLLRRPPLPAQVGLRQSARADVRSSPSLSILTVLTITTLAGCESLDTDRGMSIKLTRTSSCWYIGDLSVGVNSQIFFIIVAGAISQIYIRRKHPGFFRKYNYLMCGAM